MDAAHKLIKTAVLLSVIALLMAAPGWAQVLNVPTTVNLSGTAGQDVTVTSSTSPTTEITYTIGAPIYSSDNNGVAPPNWLKVSGGLTTPTSLSFNLFSTSGLLQGTHQATVTLTPTSPATAAPVTVTVTYTSGSPGGGGTGTLAANPNPIVLTAPTGNSAFPAVVTISTTSPSAITLTLSTNTTNGGSGWLTATISGASVISASSSTTIQVTANAAGLVPSTYQGSVTVTPLSSGLALVIPVTFTVTGTSGGSGFWTVTPNSVPFSLTTNSGNLQSASVTVTTTTTATSYNAAASSNGWLLVNGSFNAANGLAVGVPITLSVSNLANGLSTGTYAGTVTITDLTGAAQATVNVTLTVNGGSSSGLNISPNPLSFNTAVNGGQQNASVAVSSTTGGALSVNGTLPGWLSFSLPNNTAVNAGGSTAFTVNVNPAGLPAATYSTNLGVSVGPQSGILVVNLVVGGGGGTGSGSTAVAPTALTFAYQFGTDPAKVAQQKIVLTGAAGNWSTVITNGGSWLNISPSGGGALPEPSDPPTVFVTPTGLAVGSYTASIAITTAGGTLNLPVTLNVTAAPILLAAPGSLAFVAQTGAGNPQPQSVFFSGTDATVGALAITATANNPWITVSSSASSMTVFVDPTGLASGVYSGSITVVQPNVANSPYTYPVLMVVNGGAAGPLIFTPTSLAFSSNNGVTTPASSTLTVGANAATNFTYSTSVNGGVNNWITIAPAGNGSGTTTTNLTVSVNPAGLTPNTYTGAISFNANGTVQIFPVTLTVGAGGAGGNVTVTPTSLTFSGQAGATTLATQSIAVSSASGTAPVSFTVTPTTTTGGTWLSTNANPSNSTPSTINVTANPSSLQAGTYTGNLAIQPAGGTLVNVPITLNITAVATVTALPTSLTFNYRAGDTAPAAQTVAVAGTGLTFSATAVSTGNWLVVSPATGTAPGAVSVSIAPAGLVAGTYNGTVTIAGTGAATGTTTVNVTLTVTVPLPTVTKVTNAGSFATGTIAPGEIITLFAADPTHPIGPTTPVGLTLDSTGKVSTSIGGVQVLINGLLCPMVFANATQVSAVVPYEVAQLTGTTVNVLVRFLGQTSNGVSVNVATTAPGLFTANSSGTGPGAILNTITTPYTLNAPNNPATRGDTVVVYVTGEGQTSPAGVTGKVTTVSATPPLTPGPLLPVSILVGGQPANFSFAGEAPGFVSGAMQLNVQIPPNSGTGEQEILVTIGGNQSQKGVTVSVK